MAGPACASCHAGVVEHGFHQQRLRSLTGLQAEENQARRLLNDVARYGAVIEQRTGKKITEPMAALRGSTISSFEPVIASIPHELVDKFEPAEIYHQLLEHRWFLSERAGGDVGVTEATESYIRDVLQRAPGRAEGGDRRRPAGDDGDPGRVAVA